MRKKEIDSFFETLDKELGLPADVILTGAAAGSLLGNVRPSVDIDFQMKLRGKTSENMGLRSEEAVQKTSEKTGIAVNFSESFARWGMISLLDYEKHALPYKAIGRLDIKILSPDYWTIGKMGRFYSIDVQDIIAITRKHALDASHLIKLWAKALHDSPPSLARKDFYDHVIYFLKKYGSKIWGKNFDAEKVAKDFDKLVHIS